MTRDDFYAHLSECADCYCDEGIALCPIGRELLYEVADELPEHWQRELARILRKEELEREAEANARFYAGGEEF